MLTYVYLNLKATVPCLPIYLLPRDLTDTLVDLVRAHHEELNRVIFDRCIIDVTSAFKDVQ